MATQHPPRLVMYYNGATEQTLEQLAALPSTTIIFAFLIPSGSGTSPEDLKLKASGAWDQPGQIRNEVETLQQAGKKVLVAFGGGAGNSHQQYAAYSEDVASLVTDIVDNWVRPMGFDGVDIDFEDTAGFASHSSYNGVQFMIDLTNQLAEQLPESQNFITHAPQNPYWDPDFEEGPYLKIWEGAGDHISWFNEQFYNNEGFDGTPALDIQWYEQIAATTGPEKLLLGMPVKSYDAGQGYLDFDTLLTEVIEPLREKYGQENFGGVMGWELSSDNNGEWQTSIAKALKGSG